ncbi:putative orfan [Tupanvirus soda lake]|uniref:Orfan n=2 Tax=Tupanvirus TaxID=2094720 RepID=A0AC62ADJ9_9VIRU|nr:putative orfan [Tupanvirus soda lake]QKU35678.1 putative orfan [Tupanvirus soda lake]
MSTTNKNSVLQNVLFNEIRHAMYFLPSEQLSILQCMSNKTRKQFYPNEKIWIDFKNKNGIFKDFRVEDFHNYKGSC